MAAKELLGMDQHTETDASLVRRAKQGDDEAFRQLFEKYKQQIFNVVLGIVGNVEDAEDITLESFLKAWENLKKFRGEASFSTWLHRIAVNTSLNFLRSKKRKPEEVEDFLECLLIEDSSANPEEILLNKELAEHIQRAINQLPKKKREVVVRRYIEGDSETTVAKDLGIPVGTVRSIQATAKKKLKRYLESYFTDGGIVTLPCNSHSVRQVGYVSITQVRSD